MSQSGNNGSDQGRGKQLSVTAFSQQLLSPPSFDALDATPTLLAAHAPPLPTPLEEEHVHCDDRRRE